MKSLLITIAAAIALSSCTIHSPYGDITFTPNQNYDWTAPVHLSVRGK